MVALLIEASALIQALAFTTLVLLINEHLYRKESTMAIRTRAILTAKSNSERRSVRANKYRALANNRHCSECDALARARNKHRACTCWEALYA